MSVYHNIHEHLILFNDISLYYYVQVLNTTYIDCGLTYTSYVYESLSTQAYN